MARYLEKHFDSVWGLIRASVTGWSNDRAGRKGAALAFYTVFSLAPVLIFAIAIAGLFFGESAARGEIVAEIRGLVGEEGARAVEQLLASTAQPQAGLQATILGFVTLFIGATTALAELKDSLDQIWDAPPERVRGLGYTVRKRLLSFGLVLSLGFLLIVSLVLSAALAAVARWFGHYALTAHLLQAANFLLSFLIITLIFAAIYKVLPAVRIAWRDVWVGALVTALLFNVGKHLIGMYLGRSAIASAYGAAGSLILLLMWVYYSTQIFLLGAEFTKFYAYSRGSLARAPEARAVLESASD